MICRRPPPQLWDAIYKKREAFYEAAGKVSPEDILAAIPITFPQTHVVGADIFPGVSRFPVDDWEDAGEPIMTQAMWCTFAMTIAEKDERLVDIFDLGKDVLSKL